MQQGISQKTTDSTGDGCTAHQVRDSFSLLLSSIDHGEIQVQTGKQAGLTATEDQARGIQGADIFDEAREDGGDGPDNTQAREDVPGRQLLHEHGPRRLEDDIGRVEDGHGRGELRGRGVDGLWHAGDLDIS